MAMGYDFLAIMEQQRQDELMPMTGREPLPGACPNDGTPLLPGPGTINSVELYCPFDGWRFPEDWERPESNYH